MHVYLIEPSNTIYIADSDSFSYVMPCNHSNSYLFYPFRRSYPYITILNYQVYTLTYGCAYNFVTKEAIIGKRKRSYFSEFFVKILATSLGKGGKFSEFNKAN